MGTVVALICRFGKAKYFSIWGLTSVLKIINVGPGFPPSRFEVRSGAFLDDVMARGEVELTERAGLHDGTR